MMASRLPAATAALAVAAALTGCGFNAPPVTAPTAARTTEIAAPARFTPGHLYVAQGADIASKVYRYKLNADGLPATTPDAELDLHFRYPGGIAIGPDGDLYVSDGGGDQRCKDRRMCAVDVFAPGASGYAKPIRRLYVAQQPFYIAVDQRGYLDVNVEPQLPAGITNVYRPNARGNDKPVNTISTNDGVWAVGASRGIAYVQIGNSAVEAWPEVGSGQPVKYQYGNNYSADGIATDARYLYAQYFWPQRRSFLLATAVFRIGQPGQLIRSIVGTACKVSLNGGALGYGLAVYKHYLYEGCIDGGGASGVVLVYNSTKNGKQAPVEQLSGGNVGVAIGP